MGFFPFEGQGETLTNGERIRIIDDDEDAMWVGTGMKTEILWFQTSVEGGGLNSVGHGFDACPHGR